MEPTVRALSLILLVGSLAGCDWIIPRGPDPRPIPATVGQPARPAIDPDRPATDRARLDTRRACRSDPVPVGWVAVAYLQVGDECPHQDSADYNGVLLEQYTGRAPGSTLVICADQPTPRGWVDESRNPGAVCEGARVADDQPTARRIRRVS